MTGPADVDPGLLARLRPICLGLPETTERVAWIGIAWRIRQRTFAHAYTVEAEGHPVYGHLAQWSGPVPVLSFRSPLDELPGLVARGYPLFRAAWGRDVMWLVLDEEHLDWDEVAELLTESYRVLAPKRLAAQVGPPEPGPSVEPL
jgi:YjbR